MKTKVTKLQVNDSWGKKFTSSAHLVELFGNKVIDRVSLGRTEGMHWWRETFNYMTHDGRLIAQVTHNSDFGACTQPYGIELKVTTLVSDFKKSYRTKILCHDMAKRPLMPYCFYRLSKGLTAIQDLQNSRRA
jgi:hypothetical protein